MNERDPLGVLTSTKRVVERSKDVQIDADAVERAAESLTAQASSPQPEWEQYLHPQAESDAEQANLVLVLDALNFCFWPPPGAFQPRWRVGYQGADYDGYLALALALRKAVQRGIPLGDASTLAKITAGELARVLAGVPGSLPPPLLDARLAHLQEVGAILERDWGNSFATMIKEANGSAATLLRLVVDAFPSFADVSTYDGQPVMFYKRAQILIADLVGAFAGERLGQFHDLDVLTAFADYKVPQMLRQLGVLHYSEDLSETLRRLDLIPPGDPREVEIRAATIWGVEELRLALERLGVRRAAHELDWLLWRASQDLPDATEPYHRTLTVAY